MNNQKEKNDLGFPLGYSLLSQYYDALSGNDSESKNQVIEKILHHHKAKTVLDLSCGTGSQVFYLASSDYSVTAVDISPALLKIAKKRAQKEGHNIPFIEGDMRSTNLGSFDAVITMFNAIGHLSKNDFEKTIINSHKNLKKGGLYIFDIFNVEAMTDAAVNDLAMDNKKTVDNTKIHNRQYSEINRDNGQLKSYDQFSIEEKSKQRKEFKGQFKLQLYSAKELRELLKKNGFEILSQTDIEGDAFIHKKSLSILTTARKQ